MEDNKILIKELKQAWKKLTAETKKNQKVKIESFRDIFNKTYSLLAPYCAESGIQKEYIELIAEIYLYANIQGDTYDAISVATFALSERMLNYCIFNTTTVADGNATIYIFEAREEVQINFNNIDEAIDKLVKIVDEQYWKNI